MKFYSYPIKELDNYNLDRVIVYNPKENVLLEYQFSGYKDVLSTFCFIYNPEIHKKQAIALDEASCLKHINQQLNKKNIILLEGDLTKISREVNSKKMAHGLLDERMSF